MSSHSSDTAHRPCAQWLPRWERSRVRSRKLLIQTLVWWSPHPNDGLWKGHPNTLTLLCSSNVRIQCSAAERPGARHRQMALLLIIWWQIYTAGARIMLLLARVGLKAIPTITSTLQSAKCSVYRAPRQHRCPVNPLGLQKGHSAFPKKVHHHTHVF